MQKEKTFKSFIHKPFVFGLLLFVLVYLIYAVIHISQKVNQAKREKEMALVELEEINNRYLALNENIQTLETDAGKEKVLREKFRIVKEGEGMVVIVDEQSGVNNELKKVNSFSDFIRSIFDGR